MSSCAQQTKLLNRSLYSEYLSKNETRVGGAGTGRQIGRKTDRNHQGSKGGLRRQVDRYNPGSYGG